MAQSLTAQIRAALLPTATLADVRATLERAEEAIVSTETAKSAAAEDRLDLSLDEERLADAQATFATAELELLRLSKAVTQLREKIAQIEARQRRDAQIRAARAALKERDELAAELRAEVPAMLERLVGFIRRIAANDAKIGGETSAEAIARGLPATFSLQLTQVSRLRDMRIPYFGPENALWTMWPDSLEAARERTVMDVWGQRERASRAAEKQAAEKKRRERWKTYEVRAERPGGEPVQIDHRRGRATVDSFPVTVEMEQPQVDAAIAAGLQVAPARPLLVQGETF